MTLNSIFNVVIQTISTIFTQHTEVNNCPFFIMWLHDYLCDYHSSFSKCIGSKAMLSHMLHPCIWINVSSHPYSVRSTSCCRQPTVLQNNNCMVNHVITIQPSKMHKVDMPNLVTQLNPTPTFVWYVVWCGSTNEYLKKHVFKRDWSVCSKYDDHSRLNNQHGST